MNRYESAVHMVFKRHFHEMEMAFSVSLWDVNDDGGQIGSDVTIKRSFRIDVSEEPEQEEEGTLHIRLTE